MVSKRVLARSFVGRVPELEHLLARRRDAAEGRGGLLLIAGDAGVGKSRLVQEYRRRCAAGPSDGLAVAGCRAFAQRALDPIDRALEQLGDEPLSGAQTWASQAALFEAISASFERAARRRTRSVVFEDLHWAQPELLNVLTVLAQQAAHQRLLLIGTYRDNEIGPSDPTFTPFGRLARERAVTTVALEPLDGLELAEFLAGLVVACGVDVPGTVVEDVRRRSGGNPLFAEELMRHAIDALRSTSATTPSLPISLRAVIHERLDRCDPRARELLSQASVFGRRFRLDLLSAVFGVDRVETAATLRRLRELQLVDAVADEPDVYEFRHALTRDAVYGELLTAEARRLHEVVAEIILERAGVAHNVELLAHSFWEAGQFERAAPHCLAAAEDARRLYAHDEAIVWYERAARGFGGRGVDAAHALEWAAYAAIRLHDLERATALHERAIAAYTNAGRLADAARVAVSLGGAYFNDGRSTQAIDVFAAALALAERAGDARLRDVVLVRTFAAHVALRRVSDARRLAALIDEEALEPATPSTAEFYLTRSSLSAQLGETVAWRTSFERGLAVAALLDDGGFMIRFAHGTVARQAQDLGEMEIARRHVGLGLEVARRIRTDVPYMLALATEVELRAGNLRAVRTHLPALAGAREFIARQSVAATTVRLAVHAGDDDMLQAALDLGLLDEADAGGNEFAVATLAAAFGLGLARLGSDAAARAMFERSAQAIASSYGHALEIATIALACPSLAPRLDEVVRDRPAGTPGRVDAALAALLDATVARHSGDDGRAGSCALDAARGFADIGWALLAAQCREFAGDAAGALAGYRRCEAFGDVRRLEAALASGAPAARGVLTPRERDVAALVAAGKPNQAVAETLAISRKAVEKYLTSIYDKLGVTSRAQLAIYIVSAERTGTSR